MASADLLKMAQPADGAGVDLQREKISFVQKIGAVDTPASGTNSADDEPYGRLGEFSEPGGVAATPSGKIIVADTNFHRVQVFKPNGSIILAFGSAGKKDGQMMFPNGVAYCAMTKRIVLIERAPTHQVQIWTSGGSFVKKFGSDVLQHPRALTVDAFGYIVIIECRIMQVVIYDRNGNFIRAWKCDELQFPNSVAADAQNNSIFVSDNRTHCVRVYNYYGEHLRDIGQQGQTNYPIGVCLTSNGNILIADNHNNFNLTMFLADGTMVAAYESVVKHAQCLDVAFVREGVVALASKDNKVYIYLYGDNTIRLSPPSVDNPSTSGANQRRTAAVPLSFRTPQTQQLRQQLQYSAPPARAAKSIPAVGRALQQQNMIMRDSSHTSLQHGSGALQYEVDPVVVFRQATRDLAAGVVWDGGYGRDFDEFPRNPEVFRLQPPPPTGRRDQATQTPGSMLLRSDGSGGGNVQRRQRTVSFENGGSEGVYRGDGFGAANLSASFADMGLLDGEAIVGEQVAGRAPAM